MNSSTISSCPALHVSSHQAILHTENYTVACLDAPICTHTAGTQNFLSDSEAVTDPLPVKVSEPIPNPDREAVQILVIGSSQSIDIIIRTLHQLRFAEVREWSPLLPAPTPGKLMRSLTRYLAIAR
jgi:hypothetical protein